MKDTALYEHLLGLKSPWSVKKVDLSLAEQRVVVEVVLKKGQVWADPTDATKRAHVNGWSERQWRHLDTCQFETVIKARIPQLKYGDGTVEELTVPFGVDFAGTHSGRQVCKYVVIVARASDRLNDAFHGHHKAFPIGVPNVITLKRGGCRKHNIGHARRRRPELLMNNDRARFTPRFHETV